MILAERGSMEVMGALKEGDFFGDDKVILVSIVEGRIELLDSTGTIQSVPIERIKLLTIVIKGKGK